MLAISPRPNAISPAKVKEWRGKRNSGLSDDLCAAIAGALNRIRWPGDPEPQPGDPNFIAITADDDAEADRWWDFEEVGTSAKKLLVALPKILAHWEQVSQLLPGSTICQDLRELERALYAAREYIEFPLGRADPEPGIPRASKTWHIYAFIIARTVIDQIAPHGQGHVAISRKSVVVRIVHCAMLHIYNQTITQSAISAFLLRRDKAFGLTPQGIAALTTNDPKPILGPFA